MLRNKMFFDSMRWCISAVKNTELYNYNKKYYNNYAIVSARNNAVITKSNIIYSAELVLCYNYNYYNLA